MNSSRVSAPCSALLLFGATGDLAKRMLLPSLFALHDDGLIAGDLRIVGTARSAMSDDEYRQLAKEALAEYLPEDRKGNGQLQSFLDRFSYQTLDASASDGFGALADKLGEISDGLAIFLSTAPSLFEATIAGLKSAGIAGDEVRIGLEKPLGNDFESSNIINDAVAAAFTEAQTFRIDHYLGKETVQNLMALRFANIMFEPLWNSASIDHVEITVSETVGLEGRHGFYDDTGALRDMVQNHMLQLLALTAMEPPANFDATSIRDEKVKVLRSLRTVKAEEMVRGQYGEGAVKGEAVHSYADDFGGDSDTETFVAIKAHIDNWRWKDVPFYLRTGKRLAERRSEIVIQFKSVPHNIFAARGGRLNANRLVIRLQPEEYVRLQVMAKEPGLDRDGVTLRDVPLDLSLSQAFAKSRDRIAYERLLLDLIEGDPTLFVRRDEVEAQWRWVDAIRELWADNDMTTKSYGSGSWGPSAAIALTERDGVSWHECTVNIAAPISWAARADAEGVADHIAKIISRKGDHWLAVPGGRTPLPIFDILSRRSLPWGTVSLMLTDDRIVPDRHPASNQGKLEAAFDATPAHIARLETGMMLPVFDLVWLGMGADGHIASLFPNMNMVATGEAAVVRTVPDPLPPEAPFERLSLNMSALTQAKEIMLVVRGCDKKKILDAAIAGENDLPVARLIKAARCPITIFWSRS